MKGLPSQRYATATLSLFMAAWIPASAAYASCADLEAAASDYESGSIDENPLKPTDLDVGSTNTARFEVYWENPSNRPANTITGHCVHVTHTDSGDSAEDCSRGTGTYSTVDSCITGNHCIGDGAFDIKVKLKNNCELTDEYSDSVSYEYKPAPLPYW